MSIFLNFISAILCVGFGGISAQSTYDIFCDRPTPLPISFVNPQFDVYAPGGLNRKFSLSNLSAADSPVKNLATGGFFKKGRQIIFVVHGYFGDLGCQWWLDIKDSVMKADESTVFVLNWGLGADNPLYGLSASTTQTVAAAIAVVAQSVSRVGIFGGSTKPADLYFYCVGHSLGAQVCGQAGRIAKSSTGQQLFNRVTGLDPASPGFETCTDRLHIDKDSAQCVDIIHTDGNTTGHSFLGLYFGTMRQWGHIDFYPNGGANQPPCADQWIPNDSGCSHDTAIEYFTLSVRNKNMCMAVGPCTSPVEPKSCKTQTQSLGYYSSCYRRSWAIQQGIFYVDVSGKSKCQAQGSKYCPTGKPTTG